MYHFAILTSFDDLLAAVQHSPSVPLQILAGPGSGKTKACVLISRIAHLILHYSVPPESICAVTFTNKAANEMRQRLNQLLGEQYTCQIKMGTFHALCALFLRKYANVIGLERNFTVCDSEESKKLVSGLLKLFKDDLATRDIILKESTVLSMISKAKARGLNATIMQKECKANKSPIPSTIDHINAVVSDIYESYEKTLRQTNSLDFDDLLLFGVKLFRNHSKAVDWCHHVLVDEFQDTNVTQYELMHELAVRKCVTVVGDPDQSIYGWRSAEVENLSRMQKDYPQTKEIFLEENYRSTGSILNASLAIVTQDKNRIQKSLFTSHPLGSVPVLHSSISEQDEATKIAIEIKRAIAYTGGLLNYGDFAILLRFTALSRTLEGALQKEGIRSRVLGGHKFFERLEIKDLLAYLQLIDNPEYDPAFLRIANVPSRGVGEKTLDELSAKARGKKLSMLAFIEKICDNHIPDIKPPIKRKLGDFVKVMLRLKRSASEGATPPELIRQLLQQIDYENHLKRTQTDWETRWENVQELITFSSEANATDPSIVEEEEEERPTPLRLFLQASMLSSEGDSQNEENNKEKVTIVTCHAAKGLEWPVVFVPSVEDGTFPFYRTEDVEEERRLLYVACTRAQCLLYLSYAKKRKVAGETKNKVLSPFISTVKSESQPLFTDVMPQLDPAQCQELAHILGRPEPDHGEVQRQVAQ
ncbi:P-loop containing nucleoside triphosphate hydrolase protein [Macrolepiota fuliginosa MF-IS2]|uniref:DNA 3'-5' helicase n=1 Tax=Macrolepiota fuliginosa MF-IS2 TaxID=1400762 RepID=A0A9P5X6L4_9AGAR|nr:P-loop containing nucleoside triphosphate hydrolase protein [Macrolepiota fuliginosa MF-IS2]